MPFQGPVVVREVDHGDGTCWELVEPLTYQGRDELFTVPPGFGTDFASVPREFTWLIPRYGRYTKAAILHDYLCVQARQGSFKWVDADGIFRRVMREEGVALLRRWTMWAAVRLHSIVVGDPRSLWTQGGLPLLQLVVVTLSAVALLAVPAAVIGLWLLLAAGAEALAYLPARIFSHGERVNRPRVMLPR